MSNISNPYSSPGMPFANNQPPPTGALTAIGVIALILGILGFLTSEFGIGGLLFQSLMLDLQKQTLKGAPAQMQESQAKMMSEIAEVTNSIFVPQIISLIFKFVVEIGVIVGAILVLKHKARMFAVGAFLGAILSDLLSFGIQCYAQVKMGPAMAKSMNEMMKANPGNANAPDMSGLMQIGTVVGITFGIVWVVVKLGFFGWALTYLNRDATCQLFEQEAQSASGFSTK